MTFQMTREDLEACYDEALDRTQKPVIIAGIAFDRSSILKALDPIAYREFSLVWANDMDIEVVEEDDMDGEYDDSMDGDAESALASAGWGTDEDYGSTNEEY